MNQGSAMIGESQTSLPDGGRPQVIDTRTPAGPDGRTYAAPFAAVWDLLDAEIRARRNWELVHADEERGLFTIVCRCLMPPGTDDLSVWVCLDEDGLTRVDVRSSARGGRRDFGANQRRVNSIIRALDEGLGTGNRIRR
jgi:hypothetical protein